MSAPKTAMVLAGGLGTRMRPLTEDRPKAMIPVAGKPLIDHTLDRLAEVGVERAVVNVHHFADMVEDHLAKRIAPKVVISDERAGLLDSGGGIAKALPLLGAEPFYVANIDIVWEEGEKPALQALADAWDSAEMEICILLAPRARTYGYERPEGFVMDPAGRLTHSNSTDPLPPYNNIGMQIMKPAVVEGQTVARFSIVPIWKELSSRGRLHGAVMDGYALHVSDPEALAYVEAHLR
jgi:MurNAc alpha-1-phosphate uridylyltransferase